MGNNKGKADALIIGGGIIGCAIAFYLAKANFGRIILLEKEPILGSGSTAKAAGGIRAQFANRVNVEMSMLSEKLFCRFHEDTGFEALFDQVGYMFLLSNENEVASFTKSIEMQQALGLNVSMLSPKEASERAPNVRMDDILKATYCPDDGLGDPYEFLSGYEKAARKMGVEFHLKTEVTGLTIENDKIIGVKTAEETITCDLVINASGAYSGNISRMAGLVQKVAPIRRQCVTTGPLYFINPDFPMVVDVSSGLYLHKESKGLLLGWADKDIKESFDISVDPDYTDNILEKAMHRIPLLETAEVANQWAGLYETTPDHRAIIGFEPKIKNLFHVTGFSGHGMMQAPAAGLITMEILTGKTPSIDITDLRPDRFKKGELVNETNVI